MADDLTVTREGDRLVIRSDACWLATRKIGGSSPTCWRATSLLDHTAGALSAGSALTAAEAR